MGKVSASLEAAVLRTLRYSILRLFEECFFLLFKFLCMKSQRVTDVLLWSLEKAILNIYIQNIWIIQYKDPHIFLSLPPSLRETWIESGQF